MIKTLIYSMRLLTAVALQDPGDTALIRQTTDFTITGKGDDPAWEKTAWLNLTKLQADGRSYASKSKMLYSGKGLYLLFSGEDSLITTKDYKDDQEIYEGDVFEFFLRTDTTKPPYFEYEVNHLERQLILTLARYPHDNMAWSPWSHEYKDNPLIKRKTSITGSSVPKPGAAIRSWTAEIFLPYALLGLLPGMPPKSGTVWHANFCRIDYDGGKTTEWSWSRKIKSSFHELEHFGVISFE